MTSTDDLTAAYRKLSPTEDPGGLAAAIQAPLSGVLVALGVTDVVGAKVLLIVQAVIGLGAILWARARAWPPAKVWLESLAARTDGARAEAIVHQRPRRPLKG